MRKGFLLTSQEIGRRGRTVGIRSFIEALGVRVSERGPSTDTRLSSTLLVLWDVF